LSEHSSTTSRATIIAAVTVRCPTVLDTMPIRAKGSALINRFFTTTVL
jgi:hypothetical protein